MNRSLEGRYRRLLRLYPAAFRARHEEEMLGVLLDGAPADAARPAAREIVNLVLGAVVMHVRHPSSLPSPFERAHARVMLPLRIAIGLWLTALTVILVAFSSDPGYALITGPFAVLHFWLAFRLTRPPATPA